MLRYVVRFQHLSLTRPRFPISEQLRFSHLFWWQVVIPVFLFFHLLVSEITIVKSFAHSGISQKRKSWGRRRRVIRRDGLAVRQIYHTGRWRRNRTE